MYVLYDSELVMHITGCYNLFVYNIESREVLFLNDRLGYLPLYYYLSDEYFVFGSKIDCILSLKSHLSIQFDEVSIFEQLYFNQLITDNTLIKNVKTISNASKLLLKNGSVSIAKYWNMGELFNQRSLNSKKESFDLLDDAIKKSIHRIVSTAGSNINVSLTGGWDSRLILSYILNDMNKEFKLYSFGAKESSDILIPQEISIKEKLNYTPYILDQNYLTNHFLEFAKKTIELSAGARNYKRAHYLYSTKQIGVDSDSIMTGIFGDEVLKTGKPQGNAVLSNRTINLVEGGFDTTKFRNSVRHLIDSKTLDELLYRIDLLQARNAIYHPESERLIAFRFETNLRKYFGAEANSYNDFVYCYSPFIDYEFLKAYTQTCYSNHRQKTSNKFMQAMQSVDLYTKLVLKNYPTLAIYNSSRGYSMQETRNYKGRINILLQKALKKKMHVEDTFATKSVDSIFEKAVINSSTNILDSLKLKEFDKYTDNKADIQSLKYWLGYIQEKYQ
jgi:asparagine synthetase B (glutamine-hydrolysing)